MNGTTAHFLKTIFRLRGRQIMRILKEGGLSLWLMLPVILAVLVFTIFAYTHESPLKLNCGVAVFILFVEIGRTDGPFLFLFRRRGLWLRVTEYVAFALLLNIYALLKSVQNVQFLAIPAALILVISMWPAGVGRQSVLPKARPGKWILGLLPRQLYEVRSGLRPLFLGLLMVWALTLWAAIHVPIIPFVMPLFAFVFMDSLSRPEPVALTQAQQNFNTLIWEKWGWNVFFFLSLFGPHLILTFIFLPATGELKLGVCVSIYMCLIAMLFAILLKYSSPPTAGSMSFADALRMAFFTITIPIVPVSFYLLYKQYKKAQWQLQRYFR